MVLGNTTQSEALEAAADTGVFGVVDESESPVVEAETKEEGNKREQAKRKALTDTDASHKQAINAIVSTFRSQLVRYADMNLLDFRQVLYVADFYMWVPPALTELKSSVKAKVLIRKRSLWNQFCAEELPKLKKDEDGKWIDPDPPAPEGLEAPEAIGNGNSPSVVDPSLQNPVMPMSSAITEGGGAGDSEADPLDLAALPDRPLSDDECNNREDNDDEKKEFPLTEASKILSRMFKKIQRLDRPRLEGYIQRRDKWNAEMDRGQCVAGFSWLTAADGCDVDLSRHNRNRLTLRSMFKTEMAAWVSSVGHSCINAD